MKRLISTVSVACAMTVRRLFQRSSRTTSLQWLGVVAQSPSGAVSYQIVCLSFMSWASTTNRFGYTVTIVPRS